MDTKNAESHSMSQPPLSFSGMESSQEQEGRTEEKDNSTLACLRCQGRDKRFQSKKCTAFCIACLATIRTTRAALKRGIAPSAVAQAIAKGILPQLNGSVACVDCGKGAQVYDHRDYNFPLQVAPVCQRCNLKRGKAKPLDSYRDPFAHWSTYLDKPAASGERLTCLRCGKEWYPRSAEVYICPKCKSAKWNVKKPVEAAKN